MKKNRWETLQDVVDAQRNSTSRPAQITRTIYIGEVVDNDDPLNLSRLKVYIEDIDFADRNNRARLPWCSYFFAQNIQHIPKIGEKVVVILENPWKKVQGRWWVGPTLDGRNVNVPLDSVALSARPGNVVELKDNKDINITTDSANTRRRNEVTIFMNDEDKKINIDADEVILSSTNAGERNEEYSLPKGELLVELLDFMLETLMTHTHPPNSPPHPTFFERAITYKANLKSWLLNNKVKHKGNYER